MDTTASPEPVAGEFLLREFRFAEGGVLPERRLRYTTLGTLHRDAARCATNAVLLLHGTGGSGRPYSPSFARSPPLPGFPHARSSLHSRLFAFPLRSKFFSVTTPTASLNVSYSSRFHSTAVAATQAKHPGNTPMRLLSMLTTLLVGLLLLAACSADAAGGPPPSDFSLRYDWREGSLPPPYHYEYTISLSADGTGLITMVPDYPGPSVPVWEEAFSLAPEEVDRLHDLLIAQGLLRERWSERDDPPVGGSYAYLEVTRQGSTIKLPAFPVESQSAQVTNIFAAVEAIVPQPIRADLEQRRAAYEAENL